MDLCDFARSFMTFTVESRVNIARIQLDARCTLVDQDSGAREDFVLITPCKSEEMYVDEGLFKAPNYDFMGIWSQREFVIIRTHASHDPERTDEWEAGVNAERFAAVKIDYAPVANAVRLETDAEVFRATLDNQELIARTRLTSPGGDVAAMIDYPIKTMNVRESDQRFQVDTGPILVPDWQSGAAAAAERFRLAFVCYNRFEGVEFVFRQPTPVGDGATRAMHYSQIEAAEARHEIYAVNG